LVQKINFGQKSKNNRNLNFGCPKIKIWSKTEILYLISIFLKIEIWPKIENYQRLKLGQRVKFGKKIKI